MSGFFVVTDVPVRRVVQYKRVSGSAEGAVFISDESLLGEPVDEMPYAAKTGIAVVNAGMLFEVPYLEDAGGVYFSVQPESGTVGNTLKVEAKAGSGEYVFQWYKDGKQVLSLPSVPGELVASEIGEYYCVVTDYPGGGSAVSKVAQIIEE